MNCSPPDCSVGCHFLLQGIFLMQGWNPLLSHVVGGFFTTSASWEALYPLCVCVCVWVAQSCPILCDPMDYSPPSSSVHGILQAGILEWVAILFSRESSWPRDQTHVSHFAGRFFTFWATSEAPTPHTQLNLIFKEILGAVLHKLLLHTGGAPRRRLKSYWCCCCYC